MTSSKSKQQCVAAVLNFLRKGGTIEAYGPFYVNDRRVCYVSRSFLVVAGSDGDIRESRYGHTTYLSYGGKCYAIYYVD